MDANERTNKECPLKSKDEFEECLKEMESNEQLYSIALFDILGFSNFVENNRTQIILDLYTKLLDLIEQQKSSFSGETSFAGCVAPVPITPDWKSAALVANGNGFINVAHFSDTFIIYVNYNLRKSGYWLADTVYDPNPLLLGEIGTPYMPVFYERHNIYLSFLQTCMEFFCQAIVSGIPLRGCIATGMAMMDRHKFIYFGNPLVEAARGEPAQNSLGIAFGKSFNNYHPVYNKYFIPYTRHIKEDNNKSKYLSPIVIDWARYWRENPDYKEFDFKQCIRKMNTDSRFSSYYDKTMDFFDFSEKHEKWSYEIDREGIRDITDYYDRVKDWCNEVCKKLLTL